MEVNLFLKTKFIQLSDKNICNDNEFLTYDNFKQFINSHYNLDHMEKHNYIKYVKVKRQILKLKDEVQYSFLINKINDILRILSVHHTFPYFDIQKYMYKLHNIFKLIEDKRIGLYNTLKDIRTLFDLKNEENKVRIKILIGINTIRYRYTIYLKYSKQLTYYLNKLIDFEYSNGIDHKMIELNNLERSFLGKKSEYTASKAIIEYVNLINNSILNKTRTYYSETNIDFLRLLNISQRHNNNIKGEVDCLIIYKENDIYYVDKIIEVKSSIKATFEDITKFEYLQKHINAIFEENPQLTIKYNEYIFTKDSFSNIMNNKLIDWVIYICVNTQDYIEKSHLYFSNCLKIIDDDFINNYYMEKCDNEMIRKYNIICNNRDKIDRLFDEWANKIDLYSDLCNVFISK